MQDDKIAVKKKKSNNLLLLQALRNRLGQWLLLLGSPGLNKK
jgi:hypothetical protein